MDLDGLHDAKAVAVVRSGSPCGIPRGPEIDLSRIHFTFMGRTLSGHDFLRENNVLGMVALKNGRKVIEEYGVGVDPQEAFNGFSMAKLVVALLFGAALGTGTLGSVDDPLIEYLPELEGTAYASVRIEELLRMTSGVSWMESYSHPRAHASCLARLSEQGSGEDILSFMKGMRRIAPAGSLFNYNTGEVHLAGVLLQRVTGVDLADYLSCVLWKPRGMERDAQWLLTGERDVVRAGSGMFASLGDWARVGQFCVATYREAPKDVPIDCTWMRAMSTGSRVSPKFGYFAWIGRPEGFFTMGLGGQHLYMNPGADVVVAIRSSWPAGTVREYAVRRDLFLHAITNAL